LGAVSNGVDQDLAAPSSCGVGQWRIDGDLGSDGQSDQVFEFTEDGDVFDELWEVTGEVGCHAACGRCRLRFEIGCRGILRCPGCGGSDFEPRAGEVPALAVGRARDAFVGGDEPEAMLSFDGLFSGSSEEVHVVEKTSDRRAVKAHCDSFESIIGGYQFAGKAAVGRNPEDSNILVSHGRLHVGDEFRDTVRVDRSGEGLEVAFVVLDPIGGGVDRASDEGFGWGLVGGEAECVGEVIEFKYGSVAERVDDFSGWEPYPAGGGSDHQHVGAVGQ